MAAHSSGAKLHLPPVKWLVVALLLLVLAALSWFSFHQHRLSNTISRGGMSADTKQRFLKQGVDCHEIYELQGHEQTEGLMRMFGLSQHEFYALNPGMGMEYKSGQVICIRGIWGVSEGGAEKAAMAMFWPGVAIAAAAVGFLASKALSSWQQRRAAGTHGHAGAPSAAGV